eukprot:366521-Chlamydomonas_euryale.AAC.6
MNKFSLQQPLPRGSGVRYDLAPMPFGMLPTGLERGTAQCVCVEGRGTARCERCTPWFERGTAECEQGTAQCGRRTVRGTSAACSNSCLLPVVLGARLSRSSPSTPWLPPSPPRGRPSRSSRCASASASPAP